MVKIRITPDHQEATWRMKVSAIAVERILDLATMCAISISGLSVRFGYGWAVPLIMISPIVGSIGLATLCTHLPIPAAMKPYLEVFAHKRRILIASALTVPVWLLYCVTWWAALHAMNVFIHPSQVAILVGGVMITVAASMTPGGIGVAELSSRGLLIWLGISSADADVGAVALRLLTPLIAIAGLICTLPLAGKLHRIKAKLVPSDVQPLVSHSPSDR
jgi:uncharacterized membrane protein YbhN (UPF0104 family)